MIFIEREGDILRIALREDGKLKECFIEEDNEEPTPGEIYKGVVKSIVPAIKCAFIDIGYKRNAYMYLHERFKNQNIRKGDEVLVEIMKEPLGEKGPKVTCQISIPGRYVVIVTHNEEVSFSKKLEEKKEFKEYILANINKPDDVGIMIRTNAVEVDIEHINAEIRQLYNEYTKIIRAGRYCIKPKLLFNGGGTLGKVLIDILSDKTNKVIANNEEDYDYIVNFTNNKPDLNFEINLHKDDQGLFSYYNIEKEILSLRNSKVALHSGGNIVIEKTEAMYVIDVNSGKNVKETSIDKTALITNLEAAKEIARQIMIRNLSGIIVIDFIDIDNFENKKKILNILKEEFKQDKKKTIIYPFTQLNLVQVARKRRGKSIYDYIEEDCRHCHSKGKRVKLSYLNSLIKNEIIKINKGYEITDIYIEIDEAYRNDVLGDVISFVKEIDALDKRVYVNFMSNLESFKVEALLFASQLKKFEDIKIYG